MNPSSAATGSAWSREEGERGFFLLPIFGDLSRRKGQNLTSSKQISSRPRLNAPTKGLDDPLYQLECLFALEPSFVGLVNLATETGWDKQHVLLALVRLVADDLNGRQLN